MSLSWYAFCFNHLLRVCVCSSLSHALILIHTIAKLIAMAKRRENFLTRLVADGKLTQAQGDNLGEQTHFLSNYDELGCDKRDYSNAAAGSRRTLRPDATDKLQPYDRAVPTAVEDCDLSTSDDEMPALIAVSEPYRIPIIFVAEPPIPFHMTLNTI